MMHRAWEATRLALLLGCLVGSGCGGHSPQMAGAWQPYQPVVQGGGQGWRQVEAQERASRSAQPRPTSKSSAAHDGESAAPSREQPPAPQPASDSAPVARAEGARSSGGPRKSAGPGGATKSGSQSSTGGASSGGGAPSTGSGQQTATAKAKSGAGFEEPEQSPAQLKRDVVYLGYLQLEVRRRVDALLAIEAKVKERKGYVDRMAGNLVVVRVPAGDFEQAMATFAEVGRVMDRRIQALDVSEQVSDLGSRLAVLREARERLLQLLARAQNVEERLALMEQIKRLSGQIEELEASLQTLRALVAWQTITIELVSQEGDTGIARRSAFPFVRALGPGKPGPAGSADDVRLGAVQGFVALREADPLTARAADSSSLQVFGVDNEPKGDAEFWHKAVAWELEGRGDKRIEEGKAAGFHWQIWQSREPRPWSWLLAVKVVGERLWVVSAFLPDPAALGRHKAALLAALPTVEVQQ